MLGSVYVLACNVFKLVISGTSQNKKFIAQNHSTAPVTAGTC
jgi:hypothetical protein